MHYGLAERDLLIDKVWSRAQEAGFDSLLDYYYFLRYDEAGEQEFARLVEQLVVGETFFFREFSQLNLLVSSILEPMVKSGKRPRVWSSACASGEEVLSVAMLLADRGLLHEVDLVASDISERALKRARLGRFGRRSVRDNPVPRITDRWLQMDGETYVIARELIDAVDFRHLNLTDEQARWPVDNYDVVLCRNVLIYFSDETVQKVVHRLARALKPEGVLFVGISRSLLRFPTTLNCEERNGVFLYGKPASP